METILNLILRGSGRACVPPRAAQAEGVQQHSAGFVEFNDTSYKSVGPFHPLNLESDFYTKPMTRLQRHIITLYPGNARLLSSAGKH